MHLKVLSDFIFANFLFGAILLFVILIVLFCFGKSDYMGLILGFTTFGFAFSFSF